MLGNKKVLAIVPARGGSKGLPGKNLKNFRGFSLVANVGNLIKDFLIIDRAIVSTDSLEIAEEAKSSGLHVPFFRPKDLSGDLVSDIEVLKHALIEIEAIDKIVYDIVLMLQPTSPLRNLDEIKNCLDLFVENSADSVWTVSKTDKKYHPLKQLKLDYENKMSLYDEKGSKIIARQQLNDVYHRNGAVYVMARDLILNEASLIGSKSFAYVSSIPHISIDTLEDLKLAENMSFKIDKISKT